MAHRWAVNPYKLLSGLDNCLFNNTNRKIHALIGNVATTERGIEDAFLGSQITITDLTVSLNASATGAEASAFAPGDNAANATINRANINVNNPAGSAYIVGGAASSAGLVSWLLTVDQKSG